MWPAWDRLCDETSSNICCWHDVSIHCDIIMCVCVYECVCVCFMGECDLWTPEYYYRSISNNSWVCLMMIFIFQFYFLWFFFFYRQPAPAQVITINAMLAGKWLNVHVSNLRDSSTTLHLIFSTHFTAWITTFIMQIHSLIWNQTSS